MRIGELAAGCDCPVETIRYYERIGLLPHAARAANGYRIYDDRHRKWLLFILRCRGLGFSQDEVRQLAGIAQKDEPVCADVHRLVGEQVLQVRHKLKELKSMEKALVRLKKKCEQGTLNECPVIDELLR